MDIDKFRNDMFRLLDAAAEFQLQFGELIRFVAKETRRDEVVVFSQMFPLWIKTRALNAYLQENLCPI